MIRKFVVPILILIAAVLSSCSVTRHMPQNSYLLQSNRIETDKETPREERIKSDDLAKYIKQTPNKRFLGTNLYLWIHSQANPNKDNWWNRFKRRIGTPPVYLDTAQTRRSATQMQIYMKGRGYYNSAASFAIDSAKRKARVTYTVRQGPPYRLGKITYDFRDKMLEAVLRPDSAATLIHSGDVYDVGVLDKERSRIAEYLKDRGYYNFSINNIRYGVQFDEELRTVDVRMIVQQQIVGYDESGRAQLENNTVYRVKDVYIFPDYDPVRATTDSSYYDKLDTLTYRGLHIVYERKLHVKKEILRQAVNIYPNALYDASDVKRAYDNVMRLGYYKSASILFTPVSDSASAANEITFIGDTTSANAVTTTEGYLACNILCTPALRQSYKVEFELSTTSNYYGFGVTLGYQNRNFFNGAELFEINGKVGYELLRAKGKKNSFEIGGTTSLSFPRFLFPLPFDRYNQLYNPRTKVEFSFTAQRRPYYHRMLSSATWGYSWGNHRYGNFTIKPIDLSVVKLRSIDTAFLNSLQNPYLSNSYQSQLIAGLSASYAYNNQFKGLSASSVNLRINLETMGNLINGLSHLFWHKNHNEDFYRIFGIRFAQYVRADINFSQKFPIGEKASFVYRLYAGAARSYSNSASVPFDRLFFSGGANSMRGWLARTLGPGSAALPSGAVYPSQLGNMKLEANIEARFPLWDFVHGAWFVDAGNVWFMGAGDYSPASGFPINSFYRQLGLDTGVGIRLDFNFFVFRIDWGIKIHNPNEPAGQRWIQRFKFRNTTLNFGVGYPF